MKTQLKEMLIVVLAAGVLFAGASCAAGGRGPSKNGGKIAVEGTVTAVEKGKDGYTAKIKTLDGKIYAAVVSAVDLAGTGKYRQLKAGDSVRVEGEDALGDGGTIKVTDLTVVSGN
ncbi:MAG TPA: hypothetical protein VIL74_01185 [Pyrinomonadaceae bacterium]|jgi:hypothetical protein